MANRLFKLTLCLLPIIIAGVACADIILPPPVQTSPLSAQALPPPDQTLATNPTNSIPVQKIEPPLSPPPPSPPPAAAPPPPPAPTLPSVGKPPPRTPLGARVMLPFLPPPESSLVPIQVKLPPPEASLPPIPAGSILPPGINLLPPPEASLAPPGTVVSPPPSILPSPQDTCESGVSDLSAYNHPVYLNQYNIPDQEKIIQLPQPGETHLPAKTITLREAILIALRNNPSVINSELTRITDKYGLELAHYDFEPFYSLKGSALYKSGTKPAYSLTSSATVDSSIGTEYNVSYANNFNGTGGTATATISQPLLRGFGYVNQIPYENAMDAEEVAKLNFKNNTISVVTAVISAYYAVVSDLNSLRVQKVNLDQIMTLLQQNRLQVRVGKLAPSELVQQEANLESTRVAYEQSLNQLHADTQNFLLAIGILPSMKVNVDPHIVLSDYKVPDQSDAIQIAMMHNIAYQQQTIGIRAIRRAVLVATDNLKPTLDATATESLKGLGTSKTTESESFQLDLTVPIDDFKSRVAYEEAKIAYKQAEIGLEETKETLQTTVINQLVNVASLYKQIEIAENAVRLQRKTLENTVLRQKYGKTTMFEVVQVRNTLLQDEINLINNQISYQNAIAQLQAELGITLEQWNIQLRY